MAKSSEDQRPSRSSEKHSREVAEQSRQRRWQGASFLRELFLGACKPELLLAADDPVEDSQRPEFQRFRAELLDFLQTQVDPAAIDEQGEYPAHVISGLARLGAFGMKIPTRYGGLGSSHSEYVHVMQLLGAPRHACALGRRRQVLRARRPQAVVHERYPGRSDRRARARPGHRAHQRVRGRNGLAGGACRASLPFHGLARAGQRRAQLPRGAHPG